MSSLPKAKILFLSVVLIFVAIIAVIKGPVNLHLSELFSAENQQILHLRLARVILAIISACGLAVSGIILQAILRNPLAEPYLLGTSSGAGLAAVGAVVLGVSTLYIPVSAFFGAVLSTFIVYSLSRKSGRLGIESLILSGVIVSIAFSAIIVFLLSTSNKEAMHGITWWLWGSLEVFDYKLLFVMSAIVILGMFTASLFSRELNAISLGEEEALHLGINVEWFKKILLFLVALITAAIISVCGIIGFVGLIIPHMGRLIVGPNHKILIPVSCLVAAVFMVSCDIISRTLFLPSEVPIGVVTAIIGTPVFIILLRKSEAD